MRTKAENFRKPKPNFGVFVTSFICTNFEAFTTFSAIFTRIRCTNTYVWLDFSKTHWPLVAFFKCLYNINVGQNSVELTLTDIDVATKYHPKNWFEKGQDERETSSVTFVINFRQNKKLNFGLHQCR